MVKEFIKRVLNLSEPVVEKVYVHTDQIGSTGTASYSGYTSEEYLHKLTGRQKADEFDKMKRSDAQVKMCLSAVKGPIKGASWKIEPFDDTPQSKEDSDLANYIFFEGMDKTFEQFLTEALTFVEHGHSIFEMIDDVKIDHPVFGTINIVKNLAFRSQRTIERWNLDKETNNLESISQYAYGDLQKTVEIPAEFLSIFTLDKEGSNYEGISALRAVYGNYFRKNQYLKLNAIGVEKFAVPTPVVTIPNGQEGSPAYAFLIKALTKYTSHEANYLTIPEGWAIDLKSNIYDPQKVEVSIDNEDKRMVKSFMANFLELGMNGFGSQSLSFDLSDFFLGSLDHLAGIIREEFNRRMIPRMIMMNRGERNGYPKMVVSGISDRVGSEFATMLKSLADSKIIIPDDDLEKHVRERFDLPKVSLNGQRQIQPQQSFGSVPKLSERMKTLRMVSR